MGKGTGAAPNGAKNDECMSFMFDGYCRKASDDEQDASQHIQFNGMILKNETHSSVGRAAQSGPAIP